MRQIIITLYYLMLFDGLINMIINTIFLKDIVHRQLGTCKNPSRKWDLNPRPFRDVVHLKAFMHFFAFFFLHFYYYYNNYNNLGATDLAFLRM